MTSRCCRWRMLQSGGAVITCLVIGLLSLHVSADKNLPFDLHNDPCKYWPDQDWNAPCQCYDGCVGAIFWNADKKYASNGFRDMAYNRPTEQSSYWQSGAECLPTNVNYLPSCGAANGNHSQVYSTGCNGPPNGINTNHGDTSGWWSVDLQRPYTVSYITIIHRNNIYIVWSRMASVTLMVDSVECYSLPGYKDDNLIDVVYKNYLYFFCSNPIRGRYFRLHKRYDYNAQKGGNDIIDITEAIVWACKSQSYGRPGVDDKCTQCEPCPDYFCDNHYGCPTTENIANITNNAAIKMDSGLTTSEREVRYREIDRLVDGGTTINGDYFCFRSLYSESFPKFVRVQLDGIWLLVSVRLTPYPGEKHASMSYTVVATRRVANVNVGRQADDVLCWEMSGPLGERFEKRCQSCSTNDVLTCPRGIYVLAEENSRTTWNLCEMEVLGLPAKEAGLSQPCQSGAKCGLVSCESQLSCIKGTCLTNLGGYCLKDEHCSQGQCSKASQVCKLPVESFCVGFEQLCMETLLCDPFEFRCKREHGEKCKEDRDCFYRFVCDQNGVCKNPVGGECNTDTECVAGAVCKPKDTGQGHECKCNEPLSERNGTKCHPKLGCSTNKECPQGMRCTSNECTCTPLTIPGQSFECRVPVGGSCVPNAKGVGQCIEGTECIAKSDGSTCQVLVNARCDPKSERSQCDTQNTTCDATFNRCRVIPGKPCSGSAPCASGYVCQERDSTCHVRALGNCTGYTQWCADNYECVSINNSQVCLLKNGAECNDDIQELKCQEGPKCLRDCEGILRCLQDIGQPCNNKNLRCREGARCTQEKDGTYCHWIVASPCNPNNVDDCGLDQICDVDKVCRIKKGETCGNSNGSYCQLQTRCVSNICRCDSNIVDDDSTEEFTVKQESHGLAYAPCKPPCNTGDPYCSPPCSNAVRATCQNGTCLCLEGYDADEHYKCKPSIGSHCEEPVGLHEDEIVCARHAACFEQKCVTTLDQPCFGQSSNCAPGLRCSCDYVCKLDLGSACSTTDQCFGKYICDPIANQCKLIVNSSCIDDIECVAGAYCDRTEDRCVCNDSLTEKTVTQDGRCTALGGLPSGPSQQDTCISPETVRPDENGHCVCRDGYELDPTTLSCNIADGLPCGENPSITCLPGSLCDSYLSMCKRHPGSSCVNSTECTTGSICDKGVCKVDLGNDCSDFNSDCIPGTACDAGNKCKLYLKAICNYTTQPDSCPAGSVCINDSVCTCDERFSKEEGFRCAPHVGRVTGGCLLGNEKCAVLGAECPEGSSVCLCQKGLGTDFQTFSCTGVSKPQGNERTNYGKLVLIWLSLLALLLALMTCLAFAYRRRGKQKKDDVMTEFQERREQLHEVEDSVFKLVSLEETFRVGSADLINITKSTSPFKEQETVGKGSADLINITKSTSSLKKQETVGKGSTNVINVVEESPTSFSYDDDDDDYRPEIKPEMHPEIKLEIITEKQESTMALTYIF